jgi:hypothetical protein
MNEVKIGDRLYIRTADGLLPFMVAKVEPRRYEDKIFDQDKLTIVGYMATVELRSCGKPIDEPTDPEPSAIVEVQA